MEYCRGEGGKARLRGVYAVTEMQWMFWAEGAQKVSSNTSPSADSIIKPVTLDQAVDAVYRMFYSLFKAAQKISTPFILVIIVVAVMMIFVPFKNPLTRYAGWGMVVTALIAFLLIWYAPLLLGILRGF